MQLQFKTIYQHKLVRCEISTWENLILVEIDNFYSGVGRITDKYKLDNGFKVLPVYQFTGLADCNSEGIYAGHIVKVTIFGHETIANVVWDQEKARFCLECDGKYYRIDDLQLEIIGHIGLANGCGGVA